MTRPVTRASATWPRRRWRRRCVGVLRLLSCASVAVAASAVSVTVLPGSPDPWLGTLALGHPPIERPHGGVSRDVGGTRGMEQLAERIFLDVGLCFNRSVRVLAVDFYVADAEALRSGRVRWRILHPIPSLSQAATQWFRISDAWPAFPLDLASGSYPGPGAYRLKLGPPLSLGFGDCVAWSLQGGGEGPFAFDEGGGDVAWAESSEGLHDAVEIFLKRGEDPLTARRRPAPHIDWTDLEQRTYSIRVVYEVRPDAPPPTPAVVVATPVLPPVEGGNPACWRGGFSFERCCIGGPGGGQDASCWDTFFNYDRCCTLTAMRRHANMDFVPPPDDLHYDLRHLFRGNEPRLGPVQDDEALVLYALARAMRPRTIVEFGTSNGFSAMNWMHAIGDDLEARVYSYDILPYPTATAIEDSDPRFVFVQKSQADFDPADVDHRSVDIAFFDAGHLLEYSLKAFERILASLGPAALVAVHDTGLHVLDHGTGAPPEEEGRPFSHASCASRQGGASRCRRFPGCEGEADAHGHCIGRAHRPSERLFVQELLRRWPEFRPIHVHSRRVFRHGLTLLQRGELWDPRTSPDGEF